MLIKQYLEKKTIVFSIFTIVLNLVEIVLEQREVVIFKYDKHLNASNRNASLTIFRENIIFFINSLLIIARAKEIRLNIFKTSIIIQLEL